MDSTLKAALNLKGSPKTEAPQRNSDNTLDTALSLKKSAATKDALPRTKNGAIDVDKAETRALRKWYEKQPWYVKASEAVDTGLDNLGRSIAKHAVELDNKLGGHWALNPNVEQSHGILPVVGNQKQQIGMEGNSVGARLGRGFGQYALPASLGAVAQPALADALPLGEGVGANIIRSGLSNGGAMGIQGILSAPQSANLKQTIAQGGESALLGGGLGLGGAVLGAGAKAAAPRVGNALLNLAERHNVPLSYSELSGSPVFKRIESVLERTPGSGMWKFRAKQAEALKNAAHGIGEKFNPGEGDVNKAIESGVQKALKANKKNASDLYDQVENEASKSPEVSLVPGEPDTAWVGNGNPISYKIMSPEGQHLGNIEGAVSPDGKTIEVHDMWGAKGPNAAHAEQVNTLGPRVIRQTVRALAKNHPDAENLTGLRTTGIHGEPTELTVPIKAFAKNEGGGVELNATRKAAQNVSSMFGGNEDVLKPPAWLDKIKAFENAAPRTFAQARKLRSAAQAAMRDAPFGSQERNAWGQIQGALEDDIKNYAEQRGGKLGELYNKAQQYYKDNVVPFKDAQLAKVASGKMDTDVLLKTFVKNNRPQLASKLMDHLTPEGQNAVKYAVFDDAVKAATKAGERSGAGFSPATFAKKFEDLGETAKSIYSPEELKAIQGYSKLARTAEAAGQFKANPMTGAMNVMPIMSIGEVGGAYELAKHGHPLAAVSLLALSNGGRRLLTNQKAMGILAKIADSKGPSTIKAYGSQLARVLGLSGNAAAVSATSGGQ